MLIVPFAVGALDAGLSWRHLPLLLAWLVGYCAFFAAGLWLRSRGKRRYWPPVRTYGVLTVVLALVVIAVQPDAAHWVVVFLPLLAFSLWCSWRRADRSLLSDGVTVLAACLMTVVAAGFGQRIGKPQAPGLAELAWLPGADQGRTWVLAGLLLAYFAGTVLYVKTMIRHRADAGRYRLSVMYHAAVCVPATLRKPVVGGAVCCLRGTGRRRAQAVAGADSSNGRSRRDRREPDPRHHAVARLSADPSAGHAPSASSQPANSTGSSFSARGSKSSDRSRCDDRQNPATRQRPRAASRSAREGSWSSPKTDQRIRFR